jgi:hypothetical protein
MSWFVVNKKREREREAHQKVELERKTTTLSVLDKDLLGT